MQSSGMGLVNQPSEGMHVPLANPAGEQAGPENPELPEENFTLSDVRTAKKQQQIPRCCNVTR